MHTPILVRKTYF